MGGFCGLHYVIALSHFSSRSRYRRSQIAARSIAASQLSQDRIYRKIADHVKLLCAAYAMLRYEMSHIGHRRIIKIFIYGRFLMYAMRWISRRFFRIFYCAHKEMFYSLLAMRYIFKEYDTKKNFLNLLLRVPTCLMLLLTLNKEGGCWWPQQWRFTWKNQLSLLPY